MNTPNLSMIIPQIHAWNRCRIIGQKRPLQPKHVWTIRVRLELAEKHRGPALFNMAVDCKLRGCDSVCLKVPDVYTAGRIKERTSIIQSETGKPVQFEITEGTRKSLREWIGHPGMKGCDFLWLSRFYAPNHHEHFRFLEYSTL